MTRIDDIAAATPLSVDERGAAQAGACSSRPRGRGSARDAHVVGAELGALAQDDAPSIDWPFRKTCMRCEPTGFR
jgi:hypothetical protein